MDDTPDVRDIRSSGMWRISIWNDLGHFRLRRAAAPERSVLAGRLGEVPPVCGGYPPAAGSPAA